MKLPNNAKIKTGTDELKEIRYESLAEINGIGTVDMTTNISPSLETIDRLYAEAQQSIGVTDSFLGRKDATAVSGKAKQFSAAQAAGRMDSKRVMKNESFSRLSEALFKFMLAYADDTRNYISFDNTGSQRDMEWSKWKFLKIDASGEPYWNTDFLFEADSTAPLAQNREAMWEETRANFRDGCFGDPRLLETRIFYWAQMATLHYPGAKKTRDYLREQKKAEDEKKLRLATVQKEAMAEAEAAAEAQLGHQVMTGGISKQLQQTPAMPVQPMTGGETV